MPPKEPTRAQLSSRLTYQQNTPAFLLKLQNKMAGIRDDEEEDDEEFEYVGNGREPIPKRPREPIPQRPAEDPGSADEDDDDEKPQVVVLKQGKHLTEREAENIRRKEKGLPPLPDPETKDADDSSKAAKSNDASASTPKSTTKGLSFSSGPSSKSSVSFGNKPTKRKAITPLDDDKDSGTGKAEGKKKKKAKKEQKSLLSFGDDA